MRVRESGCVMTKKKPMRYPCQWCEKRPRAGLWSWPAWPWTNPLDGPCFSTVVCDNKGCHLRAAAECFDVTGHEGSFDPDIESRPEVHARVMAEWEAGA